jgi:hypothetical protein
LNWALEGASKGGHKDLIEFFIDKGAYDLNRGLYGASFGGYNNLVTRSSLFLHIRV